MSINWYRLGVCLSTIAAMVCMVVAWVHEGAGDLDSTVCWVCVSLTCLIVTVVLFVLDEAVTS